MPESVSRRDALKAAAIAATLPIFWIVGAEAMLPTAPHADDSHATPAAPPDADVRRGLTALPGVARIEVSLFADGDPNYTSVRPDGTVWRGGETLAAWRAQHGGDVATLVHPHTGQRFRVDLSPYAHFDPHATRVRLGFVFMASLDAQRDRPARPPSTRGRTMFMESHVHPAHLRDPATMHTVPLTGAGSVRLQVAAFHRDDLGALLHEHRGDKGHPLAAFREALGGNEGEIIDPFLGGSHPLSLVPWVDADPDTTYLRVSFRFTPKETAAEMGELRERFPGRF